jgi:glyoxalase family protein
MSDTICGIHHVTAIAGDPQANYDFYTRILGLRLVKRTVNFDDPYTYHFYFGDGSGSPGSLITFFPWGADTQKGRRGSGQIQSFAFSVPAEALRYWQERLSVLGIRWSEAPVRFGEQVITFEDPDGFSVELVATSRDGRPGWPGGPVPSAYAIRGLHSVTLTYVDAAATIHFMNDRLGFVSAGSEGTRQRFLVGQDLPGAMIDIVADASSLPGSMGAGIVHHVAFRVADDRTQEHQREALVRSGTPVSPVMDRQYFRSIYFNEPGGVLYEIATDSPGFLIDELAGELGIALKLPPWYELQRRSIEHALPVLIRA